MIHPTRLHILFIIPFVLFVASHRATADQKTVKTRPQQNVQTEKSKTPARKVSSKDQILILDVYVKVSHDVTQFTTSQDGSKYKMTLLHPFRSGEYLLDQTDLDYLYKRLSEITTPSNDIHQCLGSFVRVRAKNFDKVGCLNSKTATATKLKEFANFLSKVF